MRKCSGQLQTLRPDAARGHRSRSIGRARSPRCATEMAKNLRTVDLTTGWTPAYSLERDRRRAHGRVPDLLGTDHGCPPSRHNLVVDRELALRARSRQHPHHQHLHLDLDQLLLHLPCFWRRAVYLRALSERPRPGADGPGAGHVPAADRQSARGSANISSWWRRCCSCRSWPARSWRMLITIAAASMVSIFIISCPLTSSATSTSKPRSSGSASAWIGSGLFLAPAIAGGREARGRGFWSTCCSTSPLIIVAGALIGDWLGIMGHMGQQSWFWFGNQGLSYIQLGRFWQIGFFAGLLIWSGLMFRALWPTDEMLRQATRQFWSGRIRLENLIWAATLNIAILYVFGMIPLTGIEKSFTITDFWRWWVVHLWVEQSFEFFAASMSAYLLMAVGLVSRAAACRAGRIFRADPDCSLAASSAPAMSATGRAARACGCRSAACSHLSRCCRWCC